MTSDLQFRSAVESDVPALVALVTAAYRGESSRRGWTTEADLLDGERIAPEVLLDDLRRPSSRVVLAERAGALLACAHIERQGEACYFGMFAVRPELQSAGVGKALLAECERIARDAWALARMEMTVIDVRDSLIAFYERRGYRRTGQRKPFPYGDPRFGIPRRDDLRFEILTKSLTEHAA